MQPNPKDYRSITDYRAAQAHLKQMARNKVIEKRVLWGAAGGSLFILGAINYPMITAAFVLVGMSIAFLVGGVWLGEAHLDGKEYNKEHDLP